MRTSPERMFGTVRSRSPDSSLEGGGSERWRGLGVSFGSGVGRGVWRGVWRGSGVRFGSGVGLGVRRRCGVSSGSGVGRLRGVGTGLGAGVSVGSGGSAFICSRALRKVSRFCRVSSEIWLRATLPARKQKMTTDNIMRRTMRRVEGRFSPGKCAGTKNLRYDSVTRCNGLFIAVRVSYPPISL